MVKIGSREVIAALAITSFAAVGPASGSETYVVKNRFGGPLSEVRLEVDNQPLEVNTARLFFHAEGSVLAFYYTVVKPNSLGVDSVIVVHHLDKPAKDQPTSTAMSFAQYKIGRPEAGWIGFSNPEYSGKSVVPGKYAIQVHIRPPEDPTTHFWFSPGGQASANLQIDSRQGQATSFSASYNLLVARAKDSDRDGLNVGTSTRPVRQLKLTVDTARFTPER